MYALLFFKLLNAEPCLFEEVEHESKTGILLALQEGASIKEQDERDDTVLMRAVDENKKIDFLRFLIGQGFSVNVANSHGVTPLMIAAKNGNANLILYLTSVHANVSHKDVDGMTALMWLARAWPIALHKAELGHPQEYKNYPEALHMLLESGAGCNEQDRKGRIALMHALENVVTWCPDAPREALILVKAFMEAGTSLTIKDNNQKTLFDYAKNLVGIESILRTYAIKNSND
jgi:ankyrin repeat protein